MVFALSFLHFNIEEPSCLKKCLKRTFFVLIVFALVLVATAIVTYRSLPEGITRTASAWLAPDESSGDMARAILAQNAGHPGLSGVYPFANGRDAFLARLALAEAADKSLDVQYYIWHNDTSGYLLLQALYRAAERGVRVRLLLDDNNTHGMDGLLRTLNDHPNAEVRLYNPFMQRNHRLLGYLSDFFRLNRRMHNKSYSADGVISIVGGRNVGDEYFGAGEGTMFLDMDVAVSGSVVPAIETDFDRYWASESVWPLEAIIAADTVAEPIAATPRDDAATRAYLAQLKESDFATRLKNGSLEQSWSPARLLSDDPAKGLGKARYEDTVIAHITPYFAAARNNINIVSPYFVPTHKGSDALIEAAGQGRKIRILTNSLALPMLPRCMRVTPNIAKRCLRAVSPSMSSSRTPRPTTARTGKPVLAAVSRAAAAPACTPKPSALTALKSSSVPSTWTRAQRR